MTEYIYAGKEWTPVPGDVGEYNSSVLGRWAECAIVSNTYPLKPCDDYRVLSPECPSPHPSKCWGVKAEDLRKRRPPEQKDNRSAESFDLFISKILKPTQTPAEIKSIVEGMS